MLQLQSSRNKILHDWKKQKEPNFLQKNKQALKQNAKQASLRTNATSKSQINPKDTNKKSSIPKPPLKGTSKSSTHQQQQRQQQSNRVTGEDSVVISKSALDNLLKQLVDAKHAANTLPPIGNHQEDVPNYQGDDNNEVSITTRQKAVTPINQTESQKQWQHDSKHKVFDYADIPGLSSSRPVAPQTTSVGEHSSVPHEKKNIDAGQIYFPFGRPGGGAPNRSYHSNQTEGMSVTRMDTHSERYHQLSTTLPTSKHSPQEPMNISPRQRQSDITTHVKSVHLDEWQIREKESKRRQNLEHYEFVRAQIAEKECKKEEARQRKALEERLEEERIAKQLEKLQREYQEEQERIRRKEEELARRNALMYQKIQEAKSTALEVKHKSKLSPPFNQNNISVPAIVEDQHYSDYDSSADDPDSRTNLDQVKVRLSFDSALRSPSMCNVIPDNSQGQEQSSSPRKHTVKSKSKSSVHQESIQSKGLEVGRQKKTRQKSTSKDANATGSQKEASHVPYRNRERKPSKIPIPTKELLKNVGDEEVIGEPKQRGAFKRKERTKEVSVHTQKGHRVSRNKVEKASTNQGTLATQQNSHVRGNSPPVPALAKKLEKTAVNSTANVFSQPTDHFLPSLSTHTSKRAQQKAAEKLNSTSKETSLANPAARLQQPSHQQQYHKPVSPPVPALAKKLQQAQSLHKSSLTEFDSHNRSILPPISDTSETDLKGTFTPVQHVLSPVGQPMTEFKSNSPPVPALAKQLNQQQPHALNHIDNPHPGMGLTPPEDHKRPMSPELYSESQFTYLPEMEGGLAQATNHEQHGLQPTQPIMYIPVSAHQCQIPSLYSQCSPDGLVCFNNSQQMFGAAPQILSPVQIMVPSLSQSPPQLYHQQADIEQRRVSSNATFSDEDVFQAQNTNGEPSTTMHLSVQQQDNLRDSKLLHLPPIMATAAHDKIENEDKDNDPVWSSSVTATPQMSQQKEEVLQHLAMMKKRLLAQQQSITKRQSSSFKSLQQSSNKLPPLL